MLMLWGFGALVIAVLMGIALFRPDKLSVFQ
jgi:hypothetical protein